jgi:putative flippase GtrA
MKSWIETFQKSRVWVFLLVGSANTLIGYGIFGLAYKTFGMNYSAALIVAYILGILISYSNHRRVTFKSTSKHHQAFTRFGLTYLLIYALNAGLLIGLIEWGGLDPLVGQAVALIFVTIVSFVVQRSWVFKS